MHCYLGGIVNRNGQSLCVGGTADHVHLLFALARTVALADLVRDLKRASTLWGRERGRGMLDFAWQKGYGAFSVGQLEIDLVKAYIEQQEDHHRKRTFQEEYRAFLQKYQVSYDERYVWD